MKLLCVFIALVGLVVACNTNKNILSATGPERENQTDQPDSMMKWEYERVKDPVTGEVPKQNLVEVYNHYLESQANQAEAVIPGIEWTERGPTNIGGRSRAIIFDKNDITNKTVIAASVGGGLFRCTDIDATIPTWSKINDFFANLGITCLAQNQIHPDTLYFGTGEGYGNIDAQRGAGVWRSTDGGSTWIQLTSIMNGSVPTSINRLAMAANGTVYAATSSGLFRSTNGVTWSAVLRTNTTPATSSNNGKDVKIASNGDVYYNCQGQLWKYKFRTATWSNITPSGIYSRIEIACAPSDTNYVYVLCSNSSVTGFFTSTNAGTSWTSNPIPLIYDQNPSPTVELSRGQGWYDLSLAVDPDTATIVYAGGVDYIKSRDAGATYNQISSWAPGVPGFNGGQTIHADQHQMIFKPGDGSFGLFVCDGGVYRSTNLRNLWPVKATFKAINSGYNVTQFYSCAIDNTVASNYFLAGAQDNGTSKFSTPGLGASYVSIGGDGGYCFIDQDNRNNQIGSYVYSNYYRSRDGGTSFYPIGTDNNGNFINPCDLDNVNNILYGFGGFDSVTRWSNIFGTTVNKVKYKVSGVGQISHIKVSPNNPKTVYLGTNSGDIYRVTNADTITARTTPARLTLNSGPFGGNISCIEIRKTVANTDDSIIVTLSNYNLNNSVYRTANGSSNTPNWVDIGDNSSLPNIPVNWCLFAPTTNGQSVLLATEMGIYTSDNVYAANPVWGQSNTGLANVRVSMLKMRNADSLMSAATYGRGLYTSLKYSTPKPIFTADKLVAYMTSNIQFTDQSIMATSWAWDFDNNGSVDATTQNPSWAYGSPGYKTVKLTVNGMYTKILTNYIYIMPNRGLPYSLAQGGDFESNIDDFHSYTKSGTPWEWGDSAFYARDGDPTTTHAWVTGLNVYWYVNSTESYIYTPGFNFSNNAIDSIEFDWLCSLELGFDGMRVEYTTDNGMLWQPLGTNTATDWYDFANNSGTTAFPLNQAFFNAVNYPAQRKKYSVSFLSGFKNVGFRFAFKSDAAEARFGGVIDNFQITSSEVSLPNSSVETVATSKAENFGPNATVDFYSPNGKILTTLINGSSHDYGLTTVTIDNIGTGTRNYDTNTVAAKKLFSKTLRIDPANNNSNGSYTIKLYYDASEVNGWKAATGNNFSNANILKCPVSIANGNSGNGIYGASRNFELYGATDSVISAIFYTGFSGFGSAKDLVALPVELINFTAIKKENDVLLNWSTASEKNNEGFEIERSTNSVSWTKIAFISGKGNTSNKTNYSYLDQQAFNNVTLLYYRLKQIDFNGIFKYSGIRVVENASKNITIKISPQPAKDLLELNTTLITGFNYKIISSSGKELIRGEQKSNTGTIPLNGLPPGYYFIVISKEDQILGTKQFVVVE